MCVHARTCVHIEHVFSPCSNREDTGGKVVREEQPPPPYPKFCALQGQEGVEEEEIQIEDF